MYHEISETSRPQSISCTKNNKNGYFKLVSITFGELENDKPYCFMFGCHDFNVINIE